MLATGGRGDWAVAEERAVRVSLLRLHGWKALTAGWLMFWTGTIPAFELYIGVWTRPFLGGLGFLAGALLLSGLNRERTGTTREVVGLVGVGAWDVAMMVGVVWAGVAYSDFPWLEFYSPLEPIPFEEPRPYIVFVYAGLSAMIWLVHLRAVLRARRAGVFT